MKDNTVQLSYIESVMTSIKDNLELSFSQSTIKSDKNCMWLASLTLYQLTVPHCPMKTKCDMGHMTHDT